MSALNGPCNEHRAAKDPGCGWCKADIAAASHLIHASVDRVRQALPWVDTTWLDTYAMAACTLKIDAALAADPDVTPLPTCPRCAVLLDVALEARS